MNNIELIEIVNTMVSQVRTDEYKGTSGRTLFLNDAERLLTFVCSRKIETPLLDKMLIEIKSKFDALTLRAKNNERRHVKL